MDRGHRIHPRKQTYPHSNLTTQNKQEVTRRNQSQIQIRQSQPKRRVNVSPEDNTVSQRKVIA